MKLLSNAVKCPDGQYQGTVSGYTATWTIQSMPGLTQTFEFRMDYGLRGMNIPATINVTNGEVKVTTR